MQELKLYPHTDMTSKIIGACFAIHNQLGPGYMEVIYQRALVTEFTKRSLSYSREDWLDIHYDGKVIGKKRVDFVIGNVLLEIKAKSQFEDQDYIQTLSYLKASRYTLALLINFGAASVQIKRFINTSV